MGKIINPATGKPFVEVKPSPEIVSLRRKIIKALKGSYDASQDTSQNEMHWQWADDLSPHAANSLSVRKKLRKRSRYEVANNGYLKGIILTLTNDFVCSGPTLQITDRRFTQKQRRFIELQWQRRSKRIKLRKKLWQLRHAKCQDGEGFAFSYHDRGLKHGTKINQRVFECDQVSHYEIDYSQNARYLEVDGIRFFKSSGEPAYYHLLNTHPGETQFFTPKPTEGKWIKSDYVVHWFRKDRPSLRGIPETVPTLPLWALLRRYTLAVVQNAEIAADFTVLLKSIQPPATTPFSMSGTPLEPTEDDPNDWFDSFPIDRGLMTVLPSMYEMGQLKPEQPVTVYDAFVNALVQEACRCLLVPRNLALGNSGGYNMASGALDKQFYINSINTERYDAEDEVLEKDFSQWWYEAIRLPDYFDDPSVNQIISKFQSLREEGPDHVYRWDEVPEHTDPVKVAMAMDILHKGHHLSDKDIQETRFNRSVEEHYENLEEQQARRQDLGLAMDPAMMVAGDGSEFEDDGEEV